MLRPRRTIYVEYRRKIQFNIYKMDNIRVIINTNLNLDLIKYYKQFKSLEYIFFNICHVYM